MKKIIFILSFLLILSACHKQTKSLVTIQGEVKGMTKGMLHLEKIRDTAYVLVDTFRVAQDGKFMFQDTLESPEIYYVSIREYPNDRIAVFAEPGAITLNTKLERFSSFAKIEGSENQKLLDEFNGIKTKFNNDNLTLIQEKFLAEKDHNQVKADSLQLQMDRLLKRRFLFTTNFAVKHADKEIAPYLGMSELYLAKTYLLDTIYKSMDERTRNSYYGKQFNIFLKNIKETEANLAQ